MGITRRREQGQVLIVFALTLTAILAVVGLLYTFGLVLGQRRTLQTAADAASLSGSWMTLRDLSADVLVSSVVIQFATLNGWSPDGSPLDDGHLCPTAGDSHLCAYYVYANGDFVCAAGVPHTKVHVGTTSDGKVPPLARGVQVIVTRQVATILPGFVKGELLQTRVQANAAATARPTTSIPLLVTEGVDACTPG